MIRSIGNNLNVFIGWINLRLGSWFLRIHYFLFDLLIISVFLSGVSQLISGQTQFSTFLGWMVILVKWWVVASLLFTIFWIFLRFANLDLWIYYFLIVPILADEHFGEWCCRIMYKKDANRVQSRLKDIWASTKIHAEGYEKSDGRIPIRYPSFIKREHLERKNFWPHWVFSIVTLFNEKSLTTIVKEQSGKKVWTLAVDLRDESYGIYSNRGKRFLTTRFSKAIENYKELSQQTQQLLMPTSEFGSKPVIQGATIPMRWASGGFLPIIFYEGKYWVSLFFRDIPPIGLNVANGASENKEEYKSLNRLIGREFSEEMILLPVRPEQEFEMEQVVFEAVIPATNVSTHQPFLATDFVHAHASLRRRHDNFCIFTPAEGGENSEKRRIYPIDTPFEITVRYHLPDLHRDKPEKIEFVVPSINPRETGIETIWLCAFEMKDGEYLIDGEYDLARNYLIRQPIIMVEMNYLESLYQETGSLGDLVFNEKGLDDVKRLPILHQNHYRLFDADVEFRKSRLEYIRGILDKKDSDSKLKEQYQLSGPKARDAADKEKNRIIKWLNDYELAFENSHKLGVLDNPHLRSLCPVTWKTLELIFAHKIDYRKIS